MSDHSSDTRDKRSGVIIRAAIDIDEKHVERRVRNLSRFGACVDNPGDLAAGKTVRISMGQVENITAEVMWANAQLAGLRFDRAVDLEEARKPRRVTAAAPRAGWIADMSNAYSRRA